MAKKATARTSDESWWTATRTEAVRPEASDFGSLWVGLEPTFSNRKTVRLWQAMCGDEEGEEAWFREPWLLRKERKVAHRMRERYREARAAGEEAAPFEGVKVHGDTDPWGVERQNVVFSWADGDLEVKFGLDPETFEFSIKPIPLAWLYHPPFVAFLQRFVWDVPADTKLAPSMAHGGGQFSLSAKTFLQGSLLADDLASRLDHPELSSWILDYPNPDDRCFRATEARRAAFERVLESYWAGGFHPSAVGTLRAADALLDRGFEPAHAPPPGLVDPQGGPVGTPSEVFRTNFAFGRAVRLRAQSVHPGYWQSTDPESDGYRPSQIMRYSEANLNRLQIAGELHVKSGEVLDPEDVPPADAPLEPSMLYREASYEMRAQMSRVSARDLVEAVLLEVHHAMALRARPHVRVRASLAQDQLLGGAEALLARRAPARLARLHRAAEKANAEASRGRFRTDWIEPETLFWEAWRASTPGERAEIAVEAITGFVQRVEEAAAHDPRPEARTDPMAPHRHRICPVLWEAVASEPSALDGSEALAAEWREWRANRVEIEARRPPWSVTGAKPPWQKG